MKQRRRARMPPSVDRVALQPAAARWPAVLERAALLDRLLDRAVRPAAATALSDRRRRRFDRAEDRRLERRIALFEIERDLRVGDLPRSGRTSPYDDERREHREREDAEAR